ncbi:uncharacterized protein PV09_06414 [Verruconis gallopava]|uniref:NADPH:adrenodoxin oxidoreductase, mitochondrial n=1 Tax=Verruconis gallopava TaxID=253628 RepID=A0A0D2ASY1_9PEZI|nr:uncharacterized protein PV09_06414 [Verruconis gallopava]KIW02264.1 hypothetical protein PV09_06414 [Verruconis gallopava]
MFLCHRCATRLLVSNRSSTRAAGKRDFSTAAVSTEQTSVLTSVVSRHQLRLHQSSTSGSKLARLSLVGISRRYSTPSGSHRPFRLAIIGAGPAGFYTASRLLKQHHGAKIDMYERLPVPFGLVRYGVAPDHPEVKNCQDRFEEIAQTPGFDFIGNVEVGRQVPFEMLRRHYDAILFTYGASEDRKLGVEGEHFRNVWSARSFVAWYNGLPGYSNLGFDLKNATNAAIIGQGNVSLDVARILLTPVDSLRRTDIPEPVLQELSESNVRKVAAIGRRGPLQAAFTIKEIRELTVIPDVRFEHVDPSFFPSDLKSLPRARRRIAELLLKASAGSASSAESKSKSFALEFLWSPIKFVDRPEAREVLASISLQKQAFAVDADPYDPSATVQAVSEQPRAFSASLAFRSIGYKSIELPGLSDLGIHFDKRRGVIPNRGGRVVQEATGQPGVELSQVLPGLYVAGWVKRGPTGVIASTMEDAFATADCIMQDIDAGRQFLNGDLVSECVRDGWHGVLRELQSQCLSVRRTDWNDWRQIDKVERERGARLGKEREKITSVEDMLRVLDG